MKAVLCRAKLECCCVFSLEVWDHLLTEEKVILQNKWDSEKCTNIFEIFKQKLNCRREEESQDSFPVCL
jgi:hypothetical protein